MRPTGWTFGLSSLRSSLGATLQEGERKFIGVMEYDTDRFSATGGWGFEAFAGNSPTERVVNGGGEPCFACHQRIKAANYVFSQYRN